MELMIANPTGYALTNKKLAQATTRIYKLGEKVRTNLYQIAQELVKIDDNALYEDDGFKNVHEYAEAVLGIKKTFSHNLVRIGREYTSPELPGSNLPHDDQDYTVTQVQMMLPVPRDEVVEIIEAGEITPDMTCREISKVIKDYKNSKDGEDGEDSEDSEDESEESKEREEMTAAELYKKDLQDLREALERMTGHHSTKAMFKRTVTQLINEVWVADD